ncbi:MAG: DUF58 domain-containing protein [Candidatus Nanopelagicales bacterium]
MNIAALARGTQQGARALTLRGKGLIAVGFGLAAGATLSGQPDLLSIALLLIALPVITLIRVSRRRFSLGCDRVVVPTQLAVGDTAEVTTTLTNVGSGDTGGLLIAESVSAELGRPAFRVLTRLKPGASASFTYTISAQQRGQWLIGPLRVTAVDPFGLVRLQRAFRSQHKTLVVPRVIDLGTGLLQAEHLGTGDGSATVLAARGNDDVVPREYHVGDDMRRIHWRASARTGALMVRREEQPWTRRASIVVDLSGPSHAGMGPLSSFETAMTIVASVGVTLLRKGFRIDLLASDGTMLLGSLHGITGEARFLADLALLDPTPPTSLAANPLHADLSIGVFTSRPGCDHLLEQQAPRGRGDLGLAFILDTAAWGDPQALTAHDVCRSARRGGWRAAVVPARADTVTQLPQLWASMLRGENAGAQ